MEAPILELIRAISDISQQIAASDKDRKDLSIYRRQLLSDFAVFDEMVKQAKCGLVEPEYETLLSTVGDYEATLDWGAGWERPDAYVWSIRMLARCVRSAAPTEKPFVALLLAPFSLPMRLAAGSLVRFADTRGRCSVYLGNECRAVHPDMLLLEDGPDPAAEQRIRTDLSETLDRVLSCRQKEPANLVVHIDPAQSELLEILHSRFGLLSGLKIVLHDRSFAPSSALTSSAQACLPLEADGIIRAPPASTGPADAPAKQGAGFKIGNFTAPAPRPIAQPAPSSPSPAKRPAGAFRVEGFGKPPQSTPSPQPQPSGDRSPPNSDARQTVKPSENTARKEPAAQPPKSPVSRPPPSTASVAPPPSPRPPEVRRQEPDREAKAAAPPARHVRAENGETGTNVEKDHSPNRDDPAVKRRMELQKKIRSFVAKGS